MWDPGHILVRKYIIHQTQYLERTEKFTSYQIRKGYQIYEEPAVGSCTRDCPWQP
jgi:hypothetical protein